MPKIGPLVDTRIIRPAETALALDMVGEIDLLRLKAIARLHARGLPPDVGWEDLLQEAFTRVFVGVRQTPEGVTMVAFLAGVMRSLKSEHWRRAFAGRYGNDGTLRLEQPRERFGDLELPDPAPGPERALMARQELEAIQSLFADDLVVQQIMTGLGEGLSAEQIRVEHGISKTDYESARKRMRGCLLREGLTCEPK
jgi:DNA-directed RNA polymerase specialized sigma24 family protein